MPEQAKRAAFDEIPTSRSRRAEIVGLLTLRPILPTPPLDLVWIAMALELLLKAELARIDSAEIKDKRYVGANATNQPIPGFCGIGRDSAGREAHMSELPVNSLASSENNPESSPDYQYTPVSAEFPVHVRWLGEAGFELALFLRELPHIGPELRQGTDNDPVLLVGRVAAAIAESCGVSPLKKPKEDSG